ncbi:MAG: hypothetical protein IMX00_06230 [Limnochordales bacterium]|nr:hypothetical protein [Limnochordales bacterium]
MPVLEWGGLRIRAELGFAGQFRPGSLTPLRLEIENTGPSLFHGFAGVTVVRPTGTSGEIRESYRAEIMAGSPARLELPLVVPLRSSFDQFFLQLWDQEGRLVAEKRLLLPPLPQKQRLWLILRYQPSTSPWLALLVAAAGRLTPEFQIFTAHVTDISRLPTDPVALAGAELIIIDDISLRQLSREASWAIQAWVDRGGLLLVTGAAERRNAGAWPWPQDFLPPGLKFGSGQGMTELSWVRYGRGTVLFWPGSLETQPGWAEKSTVAEILRWLQAARGRSLLADEASSFTGRAAAPILGLDEAITAVLGQTPLTGTRRALLGTVSLLYTLLAAVLWKGMKRPLRFRQSLAGAILLWVVAVAGAAAFARQENLRLIRAATPAVELAVGSSGRLWQDTRIFRAVPHPGHPVTIAAPASSSSYPAALPVGIPGSWQLTWTLAREALLSGSERMLGLSWVQLLPASLRWEWSWPDPAGPYLKITNTLPDTLWVLGLVAWPERLLTATVTPGDSVALQLPLLEPDDPATSSGPDGPTVDEVAGELSSRLLPALLPAELPLPTRKLWNGQETLALVRTLWQHTHAVLIRLALEEGTDSSFTRLRHDPVLLLALGLPLQTDQTASAGTDRGKATLRLLALWVEPPTKLQTQNPDGRDEGVSR